MTKTQSKAIMKRAELQSLTEYLRLFYVLAKFPFTAVEMEVDYYHQKLNVQVALSVAKQLKTYDLRK